MVMQCGECSDGEFSVLLTAKGSPPLKVCTKCAARILAVAAHGGAPYHVTYIKPALQTKLVSALLDPETASRAIAKALMASIQDVWEDT